MTAFNVVRFRVKPGRDSEFVELHRNAGMDFEGWRSGALVKTGNQTYCLVGEWESFDNIIAARPAMIGLLDSFRDMLEDLGQGLGVTDPVSGEAVVMLGRSLKARPKAKAKAKKRAAARPAKTPAKKKRAPAKQKTQKRGRR